MRREDAAREIAELSSRIQDCDYHYYVRSEPLVSDAEYDSLLQRLRELEAEFPDLQLADSPSLRVGSDLSWEFPEVEHSIPVLSLDKAYELSELRGWIDKTIRNSGRDLSFIVEEKIDGVSIVLYYEDGLLVRALTRGNGRVGNDVTANVKTIRSIPLRLKKNIDIAVRGEIFLPKALFSSINSKLEVPFANPRNLSSGTLRRIKSSEVAAVPLRAFIYEGYYESAPSRHAELLADLRDLGFPVNGRLGFFSASASIPPLIKSFKEAEGGNFREMSAYIQRSVSERDGLRYEIDGLVCKVNELEVREELGYTGHHPRWAIAYKFEAPQAVSLVEQIDVQIGRTGRVTPVARIKPVRLGGSTISNVTLHNQFYIDTLELSIGDTVAVSKRGDVIPAVEKVIEKNSETRVEWKMPNFCPSCGEKLYPRGAHHFCENYHCPARKKGRLYFFTGTRQMDIENLGTETIDLLFEKGFVRDIPDIYFFDYDRLSDLEGFGEKKIDLLKKGIEESKERPFRLVLPALGIPELGPRIAELLINAGYRDIDSLITLADRKDIASLEAVDGIGPLTAERIVSELRKPELKEIIRRLKDAGLKFTEERKEVEEESKKGPFSGQTWCVTGTFRNFKPRSEAMELVTEGGGKVSPDVTSRCSHLLAGEKAGGKLAKAGKLGLKIVTEDEFLKLLE